MMADEDPKEPEVEEERDIGSSATIKAASSDDLEGADFGADSGDNSGDKDDLASSDTQMGGSGDGHAEVRERGDLTGQTLSERYTVLERIGTGGMSVVYLARHELLKKKVAIKVLRSEQAIRKDGQARFHREAKAAASIGDPHIVDITDYGFNDSGDAFIVMELLEGRDLRETVAGEGALSPGRAVAIARQILRGLQSAHDKGIIHRDLKAENVFLCQRDGKDFVKLLDFGISKITQPLEDDGDAPGLTTTGQVLGTPQYLAPEQAHGIEHVDHRADLYAMGVILYEMLAGELPFTGKSVFEVVMKHVQEAPQPLRERRPDLAIPQQLEQVVMVALAKDPEHRYQTAREMLEALPPSAELPGGYSSQSLSPAPQPRPGGRKLLPTLGGVVIVIGLSLWFWWKPASAPPAEVAASLDLSPPVDLASAKPDTSRPADQQVTVTLEIRTTTPHASVLINGKEVGKGRGSTTVRRGATVVVEVRARGFRTFRQELTVERSTIIPVQLTRPGSRPRPKKKRGSSDLQQNPYR
jgi:serine/threonine-protein kinase